MDRLDFWNTWPRDFKKLFQAIIFLTLAGLVIYLVGYFWSSKLVIQWETISRVSAIPFLLDVWSFATVPLDITINQYLITQTFEGSDLELLQWPAKLLLVVLGICLIFALSLAVDLSRFWFLVSQVAFIFIMVGFKFEQLLLFERTDKAGLILAFLLYLPTSYYFHAIKKNARLSIRLLVFTLLTICFAAIIGFFSSVSNPYMYLANYGIIIPFALTVIFILFIGHEIIFGFLFLITRNNTPDSSNSFVHFFALSLIYLANVFILYLRNTRRIDWDFYYLDAFWILIVAGFIGLWSLRFRTELFKNILPEQHAILGYLALATIAFTTVGYFFATANDPAIEALEDAIVFSQLCVGFVFLLYILFNFRTVLIENLKVYKVVYKPQKMPFFSMRLGGLIGALGLFLLSGQYSLDQAITAYYNGIGDLHRIDNQSLLAKEYYKLAAIYAKTNHRSNYAIAAMERDRNNSIDALNYFKQSTIKQPTPFAFVNTARAYEDQGMFFEAVFTLKDGLSEFPNEPHLSNNLANLYSKTDLLDSAYHFLNNLEGDSELTKVGQTNQLALLSKSGLELSLDSLAAATSDDFEVSNNLMVMANARSSTLEPDLVHPSDSLLNPITFAWWYNFSLNQRYRADSQQQAAIKVLTQLPPNERYHDELEFAVAIRSYYSGEISSAFHSLNNLQFRSSQKAGLYNDILGQWSLQQGQPRLALDYFNRSTRNGYLPGLWHQSMAQVALGNFEQAASSWSTYAYRSEPPYPEGVSELLEFVTRQEHTWDSLTDQQQSWYLQFLSSDLDLPSKIEKMMDIEDASVYQQTEEWLWNHYAIDSKLDEDSGISMNNLRVLQTAIINSNLGEVEALIKSQTGSGSTVDQWVNYGTAVLAAARNDTLQAETYYKNLLINPFFEKGILDASDFFRSIKRDDFLAYEILLNALEVNQYSVPILKAYGRQCTRLNLDTYKQSTLETLKEIISNSAYQEFLSELEHLENSMENEFSIPDSADEI